MDIESILSTLGLDLSNPETKRGALEAIEAILQSRQSSPGGSSGGGAAGGGDGDKAQDVEIDPDLLQPSIKNTNAGTPDDVEINDEDDILKDVKINTSEDPIDSSMTNDDSGDSGDTSSNSANSETSETTPTGSADTDNSTDNTDTEADAGAEDEIDSQKQETEEDESENPTDAIDTDKIEDESEDAEIENSEETLEGDFSEEESNEEESDEEVDGDSGEGSDSSADGDEAGDTSEGTEDEEDELEIDEDELLDDTLKTSYEDQAQKAKQAARQIKRERTLAAAKKALADAQSKNKTPSLIRELEKAIEALESLQEAVTKRMSDMSDEEFNLVINRVFDAIDALGDSGLTYSSEEERKAKVQEIKTDIENKQTQAELSAEDVAQIRAETQAAKARDKEKAKYATRARGSFKGFQEFLNSLYRAIALQVQTEETRDDSWSAINRRYSGTGVLQQGKKINELPNRKIPVIDFYFDQSGSWSDEDIKFGEKAVSTLVEMEEKGQIKINIFYFSDSVYTSADDARGGGTSAWNDIIKNVIATQATNVVIMTDSDMEDWWRGPKALSYTVPGYVWYLWRDGVNAPRLPRDLKGRGGTQQFSFERGSI
jgi:hypothetical protein